MSARHSRWATRRTDNQVSEGGASHSRVSDAPQGRAQLLWGEDAAPFVTPGVSANAGSGWAAASTGSGAAGAVSIGVSNPVSIGGGNAGAVSIDAAGVVSYGSFAANPVSIDSGGNAGAVSIGSGAAAATAGAGFGGSASSAAAEARADGAFPAAASPEGVFGGGSGAAPFGRSAFSTDASPGSAFAVSSSTAAAAPSFGGGSAAAAPRAAHSFGRSAFSADASPASAFAVGSSTAAVAPSFGGDTDASPRSAFAVGSSTSAAARSFGGGTDASLRSASAANSSRAAAAPSFGGGRTTAASSPQSPFGGGGFGAAARRADASRVSFVTDAAPSVGDGARTAAAVPRTTLPRGGGAFRVALESRTPFTLGSSTVAAAPNTGGGASGALAASPTAVSRGNVFSAPLRTTPLTDSERSFLREALLDGDAESAKEILGPRIGRSLQWSQAFPRSWLETPLILAVSSGQPELVRLLLEAFKDPPLNERRSNGDSALHEAARWGFVASASLLRKYSGPTVLDTTLVNSAGDTAEAIARFKGFPHEEFKASAEKPVAASARATALPTKSALRSPGARSGSAAIATRSVAFAAPVTAAASPTSSPAASTGWAPGAPTPGGAQSTPSPSSRRAPQASGNAIANRRRVTVRRRRK